MSTKPEFQQSVSGALPWTKDHEPKAGDLRLASQDDGGVAAFESEVISLFVDMAGMIGLPRSYGEIYGLLFASVRPLSFTDIQERLDLSKGSVSQGLKALREVGAIKPTEGADPRREYFTPETELRSLFVGFLNGSIQPQLKEGLARVEAMKTRHRKLLSLSDGSGPMLQARIEKLDAWHRKGGRVLPLIGKFLG